MAQVVFTITPTRGQPYGLALDEMVYAVERGGTAATIILRESNRSIDVMESVADLSMLGGLELVDLTTLSGRPLVINRSKLFEIRDAGAHVTIKGERGITLDVIGPFSDVMDRMGMTPGGGTMSFVDGMTFDETTRNLDVTAQGMAFAGTINLPRYWVNSDENADFTFTPGTHPSGSRVRMDGVNATLDNTGYISGAEMLFHVGNTGATSTVTLPAGTFNFPDGTSQSTLTVNPGETYWAIKQTGDNWYTIPIGQSSTFTCTSATFQDLDYGTSALETTVTPSPTADWPDRVEFNGFATNRFKPLRGQAVAPGDTALFRDRWEKKAANPTRHLGYRFVNLNPTNNYAAVNLFTGAFNLADQDVNMDFFQVNDGGDHWIVEYQFTNPAGINISPQIYLGAVTNGDFDNAAINTISANVADIIYSMNGGSSIASQAAGNLTPGDAPAFGGATQTEDGMCGVVPSPPAGAQNSFLKGDGTWGSIASAFGNITTGNLAPATGDRVADFGGNSLTVENVNQLSLNALSYTLGDGAGANLPSDTYISGQRFLYVDPADGQVYLRDMRACANINYRAVNYGFFSTVTNETAAPIAGWPNRLEITAFATNRRNEFTVTGVNPGDIAYFRHRIEKIAVPETTHFTLLVSNLFGPGTGAYVPINLTTGAFNIGASIAHWFEDFSLADQGDHWELIYGVDNTVASGRGTHVGASRMYIKGISDANFTKDPIVPTDIEFATAGTVYIMEGGYEFASQTAGEVNLPDIPGYVGASATFPGICGTVPPAGAGQHNDFLRGDGTWQPVAGGGASTFIELTDTPGAFGGVGQILQINGAGDALEWTTPGSGADGVVTNVALNGSTLEFTGTAPGFDGDIDLSTIGRNMANANLTLDGARSHDLAGNPYNITDGGAEPSLVINPATNQVSIQAENTTGVFVLTGQSTLASSNLTNINSQTGAYYLGDFGGGNLPPTAIGLEQNLRIDTATGRLYRSDPAPNNNGFVESNTNDTILVTTRVQWCVNGLQTTQTLPAASAVPPGWSVHVKRLGDGNIRVAPAGGDLVDLGLSPALVGGEFDFDVDGAIKWSSREFISDGVANWFIV